MSVVLTCLHTHSIFCCHSNTSGVFCKEEILIFAKFFAVFLLILMLERPRAPDVAVRFAQQSVETSVTVEKGPPSPAQPDRLSPARPQNTDSVNDC